MFPVVSPGWKMAVLEIKTGLGEEPSTGTWGPQMAVSLCEGWWHAEVLALPWTQEPNVRSVHDV